MWMSAKETERACGIVKNGSAALDRLQRDNAELRRTNERLLALCIEQARRIDLLLGEDQP